MDPIVTPLLIYVLGNLARELVAEACKDYLKDKLKTAFGLLESIGERDKVEIAYQDAMEQAFGACLEMLLLNIKGLGYSDEELKPYGPSLKLFLKDKNIAEEMLRAIREPDRKDLPSPDLLRKRWKEIGGINLPSNAIWNDISIAFRRQAKKRILLSNDLRELINAQNLQQLKEIIDQQGGVKVQIRRDRYSKRMQIKYSAIDLANLMPAYADDPGRMIIRDVFVAQDARKNPPQGEFPKDISEHFGKNEHLDVKDEDNGILNKPEFENIRAAYIAQSPKPVLEIFAEKGNRHIVLTGEPGSGKSTLMRYLLTGIIDPPIDQKSQKPLSWTAGFKETFPLLIELRDFYAIRSSDECDSFLEYISFMGKTDQWFLDDHAVHGFLENAPSLVMFDGLDEIFDDANRNRIMNEIAGFAQRYPRAQIIVTSRPIGYKEQVLRDAGFMHFGLQDLTNEQIKIFITGWFKLTFPQLPKQAMLRIDRVLSSVSESRSIRLLAGNPMLLTVMALLAREEELPRERAKFYEKAVEVLCHHWDANRNLELPKDRYLNADDKKDLLRRIAMQMQTGDSGLKGNIINESSLEQTIQAYLIDKHWQPNKSEAKKAARRMIRQLHERNYILCLRGPHLYGFVHRTFLEYLTAAEFVHRFDKQPQQMTLNDLIKLFKQYCKDDEWHEVLRLICGQIDGQFVGKIASHLAAGIDLKKWDSEKSLPALALAIWCLSEVRSTIGLETAGTQVLEKTLGCVRLATSESFIMEQLLPACKYLGERWPGKEMLAKYKQSTLDNAVKYGWGEDFWPHFLASVQEDRDFVKWLAYTNEGSGRGQFYRAEALQALSDKWPDATTRKLLTERAIDDQKGHPRSKALQALANKWPNTTTRKFLTKRAVDDDETDPRNTALQALSKNWPDATTRKLLIKRAIDDQEAGPRGIALQALADKWPDATTRKFLTKRAIDDQEASPRGTALQALADKWPDATTRKFLIKRAINDLAAGPRNTALRALSENWSDATTRKLLSKRAIDDQEASPRGTALQELADKWPDATTRKLLIKRAIDDQEEHTRSKVLQTLATKWSDSTIRKFLTKRAIDDQGAGPRGTALHALSENWPDASTFKLLTKRAVDDQEADPRSMALRALAIKRPNATTRKLITKRAVDDQAANLRGTALYTLADRWPDATTRKLITKRAVEDQDSDPRGTALYILAEKWPDATTRKLLTKCAIDDQETDPRRAAFYALAETWPDATTRKLITKQAVENNEPASRGVALRALADNWPDTKTKKLLIESTTNELDSLPRSEAFLALSEEWNIKIEPHKLIECIMDKKLPVKNRGLCCVELGKLHSNFGGIVFTQDLDGLQPFLDLTQPIPPDQINRAALKTRILPQLIDETVHSLSKNMGWDITRGLKLDTQK